MSASPCPHAAPAAPPPPPLSQVGNEKVGRPLLLPLRATAHANGGPAAEKALLEAVLAALAPLRKEGAPPPPRASGPRAGWLPSRLLVLLFTTGFTP